MLAGRADCQPPPRTTCWGCWPPARSGPRVTAAGSAAGRGPASPRSRVSGPPACHSHTSSERTVCQHDSGPGEQQKIDGGGGGPVPWDSRPGCRTAPARHVSRNQPPSGCGMRPRASAVDGRGSSEMYRPDASRRAYRTSVTASHLDRPVHVREQRFGSDAGRRCRVRWFTAHPARTAATHRAPGRPAAPRKRRTGRWRPRA